MKWYWPGDWAVVLLLAFAVAVIWAAIAFTSNKPSDNRHTIIILACPAVVKSI